MTRIAGQCGLALLITTSLACPGPEQDPQPKTADKAKPATPKGAPPKPGDIPAPPDVAAAPADAKKTASGLAYKTLTPGTGDKMPQPQDRVKVHYTGWTTDGKMFDSSVKRGSPASFALKGVIKGWTEGLQLMKIGEKTRFWIPAGLAYGEKPRGGRPAGMLVFDVQLLEIIDGPKPIPPPPDVAAAPADAKKTSSGLAYKVMKKGTGKAKPKAYDRVQVHYTGWTTDGKMFDSSHMRKRPASFPLNGVIKGWTEGLQLMVVGESTRFWIPVELAYNNAPGKPAGMLVFDVELLQIFPGKPPIPAPKDVKAAPSSAKKTSSGLAYKVIKKGKGKTKPSATSKVTVHYTGWTTDGKMFDSSVQRGRPATFPLNGVIKGWTEGLQLMVEGEKTRFWIPGDLAYGNKPMGNRPFGTLVFDVELVKIEK